MQRHRAATVVGMVGLLTMLVWSVAMTAGARPPTAMPDVAAAHYLGPSGHREFLADPAGGRLVIETSHLPGAVAFLDAPASFQTVLSELGFDAALERYWVVETNQASDGIVQTLLSVGDEGLTVHAVEAPGGSLVVQPGLVELPPAAEPGSTWTSTGITGSSDAPVEVIRTGSAAASTQPGCLDILLTDTFPGQESTTRLTRCPGRGVVAQDDHSTTGPHAPQVAGLSLDVPAIGQVSGGDPTPMVVTTGGVPMSIGLTIAPVALGDGVLFANRPNGNLNFASPADDGNWAVQWRRRPGADVMALLGAGELAVAATTDRALVGYDAEGRWQWQSETADLIADLTRFDDRHFAVIGLDGSLSIRSLLDGSEVWTADVAAGANLAPQVVSTPGGPGLAVAAGRNLSLVSPRGTVTTHELLGSVAGLTVVGQQVVLADNDTNLIGFDLSGKRLWQAGTPDICRSLATIDEVVVCAGSTRVYGFSVPQQRLVWEQPVSVLGMARTADGLLVTGRQTTWLLDAEGGVGAQWPLDRNSPDHWVVGLRHGVLVIGTSGDTNWWAAP